MICSVGAHNQNGVFERVIKDLTFSSQTLVLHTKRYWPEYITTMFWPFALVAAADRMNNLHVDMHGQTLQLYILSNDAEREVLDSVRKRSNP